MPEIEREEATRTKLPTDLDEEQPFISVSELKLSLRQMLTIAMGTGLWVTAISLSGSILSLSTIFSAILWSWIIIATFFFALFKKNGLPYEEYLAQKIVFLISEREFVLKDDENTEEIDEIDWRAIEEPYDYMEDK